jgi:hypothetical protein
MSNIRGVKDRRFKFVQLLNSMFEDQDLSLKAKGFIGYCLTKPSDWNFNMTHLCSVLKEGEKAIYAVINECIEHGYAYRYQSHADNGDFLPWQTVVSDSKHEIQEIRREIEKSLTLRGFGDAQTADAQNVPISNTELSNTEEKQQQGAEAPAAASPEKKKGNALPEPYECLKSVNVSNWLKCNLTHKYAEDFVKKAVAWLTHPSTKITTTIPQALQWACQNQPELPTDSERVIEQNKDFAKQFDEERSEYAQINVLSKCVEIVPFQGQNGAIFIEYAEKEFKRKFSEAREKYRFVK